MFTEWLHSLGKTIYGNTGGVTPSEIKGLSAREKLSDYLPYIDYHDQNQTYLSVDNTIGYVWECIPYSFASASLVKKMQSFLDLKLPQDTVYSFHFYADPHILPVVQTYQDNKTRQGSLIQKSATEYANFLLNGSKGLNQMAGMPVRNYRLFVSIKSAEELREDQITSIEESLKGAKLSPVRMDKGVLIEWLRRLINGEFNTPPDNLTTKAKPLRKQIISPDCELKFPEQGVCKIGKNYASLLTYQTVPQETDLLVQNKLFGGYSGLEDDGNQINSPYLFSVVLTENLAQKEINEKAKIINGQQVVGKSAKELHKRMAEFKWVIDANEEPQKLMHVMQTMWVFDQDKENLNRSVARVKRLAKDYDYKMQEETDLKVALFIYSLPLGFYNIQDNMQIIDRYFILPVESISAILPLQGDYSGSIRTVAGAIPKGHNPNLISIGRKGQIQCMDFFDPRAINHNFLITAGSGAGKSHFLNKLMNDYYSAGSLIRGIDIGFSLEKCCKINKGRFLNVGSEKMVINPFYSQGRDKEDKKHDLGNCALIIAEMLTCSSGERLTSTQWSLIKRAVSYTVEQGNVDSGIDSVQNYLENLNRIEKDFKVTEVQAVLDVAKEMAFNLNDYSTNGAYGRFFNGKNTFDISTDEFVILELQELKEYKDLFPVMLMQVVNAVTQDLYLSDRGRHRFQLFEEAAHYLKKQGYSDLERLGMIIEEGYRRARKHNGSFGAVLQSILDLDSFGSVGKVLRSNAEFKLYLQSGDYPEAANVGLIQHQGLALELIDSVRNVKPYYSEIFFETSQGRGVGRICLDNWNNWVNTSTGSHVQQFNQLVAQGYSEAEAISQLSGVPL